MGFQAFFWLVTNSPWLSTIGPLISHFEDSSFTLAQTIESLRIGQAPNSLSFGWNLIKSKYQTPEKGQALNSSSSLKGALDGYNLLFIRF